jgi:small subunit ribosomal protein S13
MFLYKEKYLRENCEIRNSLQNIFGIGWFKSIMIVSKMGLSYPFSIDNLNLYNFFVLSSILDDYTWLEIRIKREIFHRISVLIEIDSYKGKRHADGLPVRGQRTRTNASSVKRLKRKKIL